MVGFQDRPTADYVSAYLRGYIRDVSPFHMYAACWIVPTHTLVENEDGAGDKHAVQVKPRSGSHQHLAELERQYDVRPLLEKPLTLPIEPSCAALRYMKDAPPAWDRRLGDR